MLVVCACLDAHHTTTADLCLVRVFYVQLVEARDTVCSSSASNPHRTGLGCSAKARRSVDVHRFTNNLEG